MLPEVPQIIPGPDVPPMETGVPEPALIADGVVPEYRAPCKGGEKQRRVAYAS